MARKRRRRRKYFTQQGIAMIAVAICLAVIAALTSEFSTDTTIDYIAATNARDAMQAHFLARSGVNLSQLVIRLQTDVMDKYRKYIGDIQLSDYASLIMGAFGGGKQEVKGLLSMVSPGLEPDMVQGLGLKQGSFNVNITTEDGKINVNCANGSERTRQTLATQLESLFYLKAYDPIFQNPSADGWRRTRQDQVAAIMDFVDQDNARFGQPGTPEQYGYQSLPDPYQAKNNYLDTTSEMRLIRGVDDRFWTLFGDQFTVYGDCKVNVGAVNDPKLIASIIMLAAKNPDDPVLQDPRELWALAQTVAQARGMGIYFGSLKDFASFVKDPEGLLMQMMAGSGDQQGTQPAPSPTGQGQIKGVELDQKKLAQIARAGPRRIYRVEATAKLGPIRRRIIAVWDSNTQNQNNRSSDYGRGSWVFWRED